MELSIEHVADLVATLRMRHERWERERRQLPRFPVWAPVTIRLVRGDGAAEPLDVSLTDLACGGVGLLSPRPLEVGDRFHLTLPATDAAPLNALCTVVHSCRGARGAFPAGARFAAALPGEEAEPAGHGA